METERGRKKKAQLSFGMAVLVLFMILLYFIKRPGDTVPVYVFTYAEDQNRDYPTTLGDLKFAELVEERTGGRIVVRVIAEGVLGSESEVIRQMQYGGIDFARVSLSQISEYVPEMNVLQLPYLYEDSAHMWKVLDGEIGEQFLEYPQQCELVGLSWYDAGARNFYCSSRPVETLEDMKGLHIRVQESKMMSDIIIALGGTPVQVPYDQVYATLERKQADGAENNWSSYVAMQHYEVAKYFTVDEHVRIPEIQICAAHTWQQLSEEDRKIIRECAKQSALYERELWTEYEENARRTALENHVREIRLSPEEKEKFKTAAQSVYEKYAAEYGDVIREIIDKSKQREE